MATNKGPSLRNLWNSDRGENAIGMLRDESFAGSDVAVLPSGCPRRWPRFGNVKRPKAQRERCARRIRCGRRAAYWDGWWECVRLAIPGVGPLSHAGPMWRRWLEVGVGGGSWRSGWSVGGNGNPEYEAKRYDGGFPRAGFTSVMRSFGRHSIGRKTFSRRTGAEDIRPRTEISGNGYRRTRTCNTRPQLIRMD